MMACLSDGGAGPYISEKKMGIVPPKSAKASDIFEAHKDRPTHLEKPKAQKWAYG